MYRQNECSDLEMVVSCLHKIWRTSLASVSFLFQVLFYLHLLADFFLAVRGKKKEKLTDVVQMYLIFLQKQQIFCYADQTRIRKQREQVDRSGETQWVCLLTAFAIKHTEETATCRLRFLLSFRWWKSFTSWVVSKTKTSNFLFDLCLWFECKAAKWWWLMHQSFSQWPRSHTFSCWPLSSNVFAKYSLCRLVKSQGVSWCESSWNVSLMLHAAPSDALLHHQSRNKGELPSTSAQGKHWRVKKNDNDAAIIY